MNASMPKPNSATPSQLEIWTQKYWNVSRCWNGKPAGRPVSTGDALNTLSGVLYSMNPARRLAQHVADLLEDVVKGTPTRRVRRKGA